MDRGLYRLGCDIGGTFTDFVLLNDETGEIQINKCLTTPVDPSEAVEGGIRQMLDRTPGFMEHLEEIIHGTTLVINSIIERKGAKTGLITTKGFRDVLELAREKRYDTYDIFAVYPEPLVPRPLRMEVDERITSDGRILKKLDPEEVKRVLNKLIDMGIESLAVCLINSFENPVHELMIKDIVSREAPDLSLSISYEVLPQIREFERTSTTVTNAYVKPLTGRYIARLSQRLDSLGSTGKLFIMLSSGGITSAETATEFPVRVIESGPTAAVISAVYFGKMFDVKDIFCFDMGGTTAKSCLIQKGEPGMVSTFEVGRVHRFKKGSGLDIQVPVVDLMEIGAGGGSIARISKMGLLQVGPDSSGADPGPVCYGLSGKEPTVTDADLALGYLDPDYFLGGEMKLDKESAQQAIEEKIAKPLGVTPIEATWGIHDLINETMAGAAKTHIAEKGGNPKIVTVCAFGGAGPVHAYGLAKKLEAPRILVPPIAGVGSALGFFTAPRAFDLVRSHKVGLQDADFAEIEKLFQDMEKEGAVILQKAGTIENTTYERSVDMRFVGQGAETNVPLPNRDFSQVIKEEVRNLFDQRYQALYGRTYPESPAEFVNFRVRASLPERPLRLPKIEKRVTSVKDAVKGQRPAYSAIARDFIPYSVYDHYSLFPGAQFDGPAIVEERESTAIIGEDASVSVDDYGFLWINFKEV
ncbi:MAG: hydantoinase/oxoprolinase family protein [Deltaproteobacteria bacterium]|nr:hydantoinase/oxoprolinase family protein [Deltaproteobacteria bacterium]